MTSEHNPADLGTRPEKVSDSDVGPLEGGEWTTSDDNMLTAVKCGGCSAAHDKFVMHGRMGVTVCTNLLTTPEKAEVLFPHVLEVDLMAGNEENELEVFSTTTAAPVFLEMEKDDLFQTMTSLDMINITSGSLNYFPSIS